MKRFSSRHPVTVVAGSLLAVVSIAAIAQAATDTIYKYSTPKIGTFSISHLAMSPDSDAADYTIELNGGYLQLLSGTGCLVLAEIGHSELQNRPLSASVRRSAPRM
jgi:hypothetical protein